MKLRIAIALLAGFAAASLPASAFAYNESGTVDPAFTTCVTCHGAVSGPPTTGTMEPLRSGPHDAFTSDSFKCATCHEVHQAVGGLLLTKETVKDACNTCHDGTGGDGVYGVLAARGFSVVASHSLDTTNMVPGGDGATGGDTTMTFSGAGRNLTCTDCHSVHSSNVVAPFIGDRRRTATESVSATATDRLLRTNPGGSATTVSVYGSSWCGGCHAGRLRNDASVHNHPAETTANAAVPYNYGNLWRISTSVSPTSAPESSTVSELGPLGGNNNGFLMLTPRPWTGTHYPICQQCHEDPRYAGSLNASGTEAKPGAFTVTAADGSAVGDNPRVQVFPHESTSAAFLVEQGDDLCLNCHAPGSLH